MPVGSKLSTHMKRLIFCALLGFVLSAHHALAGQPIRHDATAKTVSISVPDGKLCLEISYKDGCRITKMDVAGANVLSSSGVFTGFRTRGGNFTSATLPGEVIVETDEKEVRVSHITYGDRSIQADETWRFRVEGNHIDWDILRSYSALAKLEETAFPQWNFKDLTVWKGGILDNGGMVWCKYLRNPNDTYGVHTGGVTFWNPQSGHALRIRATAGGRHLAAKYSQSEQKEFTCTQVVTDMELEPRYNLDRFVGQRSDVFTSFNVQKGPVDIHLQLEYVDYAEAYSRGVLPGINAEAVRELMNTTGRYGVVDCGIVGANGWTTNWKCLHEPFFAQIGMALNDSNYVKNMSATLDSERDHALTPEGRVLSRWHNADEDQMPGTYNYKTGYYEAQWGYTVDSQTGYLINTAEQFDLCGDVRWLQSHKEACERALEWLMNRDSNGNGIFEMMNDYAREGKSSDWLDVIWASFENGFVNAQMYYALCLWAECEEVLGDSGKADRYRTAARRMKEHFNKPVSEGGFWLPEKKQYVYWRDKDGAVHGDNLVTPVNFAVIAFGLCDDKVRIRTILDEIERRNVAENLFHWPLCYDSFTKEETRDWQFPTYENGDIFPTWGYLGIRAYIHHDRRIALKYIRNILAQYEKDGLSSQRYSRTTQEGQGSDILAGICTSVTALYRDIYGLRPRWNRMGLEPHLSEILNGTAFHYNLRGTDYSLRLSVNDYEMRTDRFTIKSSEAFGAQYDEDRLNVYPHNRETTVLSVSASEPSPIRLTLKRYTAKEFAWEVNSTGAHRFQLRGLNPAGRYRLHIQGKSVPLDVKADGHATFDCSSDGKTSIRLTRSA